MKYKRTNKFLGFCRKFYKGFPALYLCIRFPFLYPRNRFTGLHYTNWKFCNYIRNLSNDSQHNFWISSYPFKQHKLAETEVIDINTTFISTDGKEFHLNLYSPSNSHIYEVQNAHESTILKIDPADFFEPVKDPNNFYNNIRLYFCNDNKEERKKPAVGKLVFYYDPEFVKEKEGITHVRRVILQPLKLLYSKILTWFNEYPLQYLMFWTYYTELDAMDTGWRKRFGIQICKEIKAALIKAGGYKLLYKYRIMQIKEKFSELRWYDNGAPDSVHKIIEKYQNLSYYTCVNCGKDAVYRSKGWICGYCEDCIDKEHPEKYTLISQKNIDEESKNV